MIITVTGKVTADAPNALSGTDLQSAPKAGLVTVWVTSTQVDTIASFSAPPNTPARSLLVSQTTSGFPSINDNAAYVVEVKGGEQLTLAIDITTGATVGYIVMFAG